MHLMALLYHGSSNHIALMDNNDRIGMHPYFIFKVQGAAHFLCLFNCLLLFRFFFKNNVLGHSYNYIEANPLLTPATLVQE